MVRIALFENTNVYVPLRQYEEDMLVLEIERVLLQGLPQLGQRQRLDEPRWGSSKSFGVHRGVEATQCHSEARGEDSLDGQEVFRRPERSQKLLPVDGGWVGPPELDVASEASSELVHQALLGNDSDRAGRS